MRVPLYGLKPHWRYHPSVPDQWEHGSRNSAQRVIMPIVLLIRGDSGAAQAVDR